MVPVYNEGEGLRQLQARLLPVLDALDGVDASILYVDDGSRDDSWQVIESLAGEDARAGGLKLSRNFGKEIAMTAGLDHCDADAVVVIDADLSSLGSLVTILGGMETGEELVGSDYRDRPDFWRT